MADENKGRVALLNAWACLRVEKLCMPPEESVKRFIPGRRWRTSM